MTSLGEPIGIAAVSRYKFVEHLATGGMAEIYAAESIGVAGANRKVAIKRVLREYADDSAFRNMFANEARLAVRLQHPNIVQTYDVLDVKGELYITMELLEGLSLLELLRLLDGPEPALSTAQAVHVVERVLAGLHYAHERLDADGEPLGIVHRDVSPHNIFLTLEGNVKLLDFGVAKATTRDAPSESGIVKGKVLYMSPEHCQGHAIDRRADIFSVGVLLYSLLTNHHPFKRKNNFDTMNAVINDPMTLPSERVEGLDPAFDVILQRALSKNPADRYDNAQQMQEALAGSIRTLGLYTTDTELSRFLQNEMPTITRSRDPEFLPPDLVFGAIPEVHTGRHPAANAALAETPHATIERIFGVILVRLHGVFDERFEPDLLLPHLKGKLLIDSSDVSAITSYGIRGLLRLYEHTQTDSVYHMRCSPAFLQQVSMVRMLLGGGRIVSFHIPYVDPVNGNPFTVVVDGALARRTLKKQTPPPRTCPGFPDRDAQFDEHPATYFTFADAFCEKPEEDLAAVLEGLAAEHQNRQVEKAVDQDGTKIWIRRPLQASFRWRNLLSGIEGRVVVDLEDTPSWTDAGIEALVEALSKEAEQIQDLSIFHAPHPLLVSLKRNAMVDRLSAETTGRVHALCNDCKVPRRVAVTLDELSNVDIGNPVGSCPNCGGTLASTETFVHRPTVKDTPVAPEPVVIVVDEPAPIAMWLLFGMGVVAVLAAGLYIAAQ